MFPLQRNLKSVLRFSFARLGSSPYSAQLGHETSEDIFVYVLSLFPPIFAQCVGVEAANERSEDGC